MYGKSNMEAYIAICEIDSQWEIAVMSQEIQTGALQQPRGEGDGREVQKGGDICIPMAGSC